MNTSKIFKKLTYSNQTISIISSFVLMFVYGALLLMIGYTMHGVAHVTGLNSKEMILLAIPQSLGLFFGTLFLKFLLKNWNTRTFLSIGYIIALICVVLISQLDRISGECTSHCRSSHQIALSIYIIVNLIFGMAISITSPTISTFLSAVYRGKKQASMIALNSFAYGVGAGIIPLAAASTVFSISSADEFSEVRYFYYIGIAFAVLGLMASYMLSYRHKRETLTTHKTDLTLSKTEKNKEAIFTKHFWIIIACVISIFVLYMFFETITNYNLANTFKADHPNAKKFKITATMAFGLFIFLQGLYRGISGLTLIRWIKLKYFITISAVFIIVGYILIMTKIYNNNVNYMFLIAALLAFGIGCLWQVFYSYGVEICHSKAALLGIVMNIVSMLMIPVVQGMATGINHISSHEYILGGLVIGAAAGVVLLIWGLSWYLKRIKIPHDDDTLRQNLFKKDLALIKKSLQKNKKTKVKSLKEN